jgi:FkbM family methyltransferase
MKRPLLLRISPELIGGPLLARWYRKKYREWLPLYESAGLLYARLVRMELVPGDIISDSIAFTGVWEAPVTRRITECAYRGGTMIDIGANLGYFALLWAASNPLNKCIAFEPSPGIIDILRRNVSRNRLENQIDVISSAAGSAPGKFRFDIGPGDQTGWGGFTLVEETNASSTEVEVVRVDEMIRTDHPIALLKVDIEGADAWALMGCERLLKAGAVREIWYEQNKTRMRGLNIPLDAAQKYLESLGYVSVAQSDPAGEVVEWSAAPG